MKVGNTVKCKDARESEFLQKDQQYTINDVNNYGNIRVESNGKLSTHWYRPSRFSLVKDTISLTRKYRTKEGWNVKLYATSDDKDYPIVGAYQCPDGKWINESWTAEGKQFKNVGSSEGDLVEIPNSQTITFDKNLVVEIFGDKSILFRNTQNLIGLGKKDFKATIDLYKKMFGDTSLD